IEVVDFGSTGIVRCKRCRTYINPFVTWADNGRSTYFSHLDANGQRRDKEQRPELSHASVEFVAPGDYMVRPPQCAVDAIKSSLDDLPGATRCQVGIITFDAHIHFYNLSAALGAPQMLVVSDISDVILPLPEDLLVNLADSMFKSSTSPTSCTGPALSAAKRVIQHVGGKLLLFQSSLPTIGEGALKVRENPRLLGSDKEHTMLNAEDVWYKTTAVDFSRLQVSVDTFLFSSQYTDLATIAVLSKYTAGSTYYYPSFLASRDGERFMGDLRRDLTRATAFEAVMRVRATRGVRFSNFYGNYYIRGTDLLALPNCTADSSFSLDMSYDETVLSAQAVTVQAALLYTSSEGERRIRVLPVTASAAEMVETLDIDCAMNLLAKQAVDIAQKTGMENARQRVNQTTIEIMRASRVSPYSPQGQAPASGVSIPSSLLLLPLYSMSLQKSPVIRYAIVI
ncbi:Sec23/Sec24 trunk domain-containing protein, partial [Ochromonadaceae sp. CCMP2298]